MTDEKNKGIAQPAVAGAAPEHRKPVNQRRAQEDLKSALDALCERAQNLAEARASKRGNLIKSARRIRVDAIDVVTMAVLVERSKGASWADVAAALALDERFVTEHYEPIERQWVTGNGIGPIPIPRPTEPGETRPLRVVDL